ncbi:MAG: tetraacyldisaccharide 4'-kinase, partial [Saprospiraceae bacterium]
MNLRQRIAAAWYNGSPWLLLLWPVPALFMLLVLRRRLQFIQGKRAVHKVSVPVIIVGNITVGGAGKTPLVIYLVEQLRKAGFSPG